jgi:radical SAM superfamily enzyme YgiQ (UPF0313 family)
MKVKLILPALAEANSPGYRPIKYSLFPPLGLATLAAHLTPVDQIELVDEHVETLSLDDEPDLVVIQCYITSARRSYQIADHYRRRRVHVAMGGLHPSSVPMEALRHADSVFVGPGDQTFAEFLRDFRGGGARRLYRAGNGTLIGLPPARRDLFRRELYLAPNSLVVSRGCPGSCEFCYKDSFYRGGKSFYTQRIDATLCEIETLPGRHLFFLDDHLFASPRFARELLCGMRGMNRIWQAAGTVGSILSPGLVELAAEAGLRSLFVGFETLSHKNLELCGKLQDVRLGYDQAIRKLHALGVMVNASFVFGMDHDDHSVFDRTVDFAVARGIETATFHILTPYPGTRLFTRLEEKGRIFCRDWDRYDTRHAVFRPARLSAPELEAGYRRAYQRFYEWPAIWRSAANKPTLARRLRHLAYAGGWKKLEPLWNLVIGARQVGRAVPLLEATLEGVGSRRGGVSTRVVPVSETEPVARQSSNVA